MGAGASRGLQSRWALAEAGAGGFDSLTPPPLNPFVFLIFRFVESNRRQLIVSCAVIPEACYLLNHYLGTVAETSFLQSLSRGEITLDHFQEEDLFRCMELMEKYKRLNLGFVDVSVVAMCERRNISTILTTDRKHFSVVRSKQDRSFQLLP